MRLAVFCECVLRSWCAMEARLGSFAGFMNACWGRCVLCKGVLEVLVACSVQTHLGVFCECVLRSVHAMRRRLGVLACFF